MITTIQDQKNERPIGENHDGDCCLDATTKPRNEADCDVSSVAKSMGATSGVHTDGAPYDVGVTDEPVVHREDGECSRCGDLSDQIAKKELVIDDLRLHVRSLHTSLLRSESQLKKLTNRFKKATLIAIGLSEALKEIEQDVEI